MNGNSRNNTKSAFYTQQPDPNPSSKLLYGDDPYRNIIFFSRNSIKKLPV
jgi:hypothetical protein